MVISGIYQLTCIPTNLIYIGSSCNIIHRWSTLTSESRDGFVYANLRLSTAFKQYGVTAFEFRILEIVEPPNLVEREMHWINATNCCNPKIGLNAIHAAIRNGKSNTT